MKRFADPQVMHRGPGTSGVWGVLLVLSLLPLLGCGVSSAALRRAAYPPSLKPDPAQFMRVDSPRRSVELTLIAADGQSNNGFNFDGYGRGELLVRVPRGWRLTVRCENHGVRYESCAVVSGPGATQLAFPGATTSGPVQGMPGGGAATFTFRASRLGTYRLASLVPGHEQARMYAVLEVTRGGRPSISARPGA